MKVSLVLFALCFMLLANTALAIGGPGSSCNPKAATPECVGGLSCLPCPKDNNETEKGICGESGKEYLCPTSKFTSLEEVITSTVNYLFMLAIVGCPLVIAIGAFLFLTSAGDPGKTKLARQMILWACIGLAVILFSKILQSVISGIIVGS
ncbi:pilin [Candidatus Parcubacteria bacterium]|nr:pilin [Candidatus Parcubacteria bacterium]